MSIPRDTYIDDVTTNKINAVYSTNGGYNKNTKSADYEKSEKAMLKQVEEITGIYADYYITLDTKALRELVDTIGGVTVNVPINMKYDDKEQDLHINLKKGTQVLNGKQAEQFVRFRKNNNGTGYPNGDIGRIAAQQEFIKAVAQELLQAKNITKLGDFIEIGINNVKTNITVADALQYVDDIKNFNMDNLRMETLPEETDPKELAKYKNVNSACYFWNKEAALELSNEMFFKNTSDNENENTNTTSENKKTNTSTNETTTSNNQENEELKIEILNGSSDSKALSKLTEELKDKGYNVVSVGTSDEIEKTVISINKNHSELDNIKKIVGTKNTKDGDNQNSAHITIIIGNDY